jgi:surfeit locus 1 family protein
VPGVKRLVIGVAAAVACAITLSLGFWQWGRAQQRIGLHEAMQSRQAQPALAQQALTAAPADTEALLHRAITLRGRWVTDRTVYLDNRQMANRQGFYVVTPLRLAGSDTVVLVQRGWAARDFKDRTRLPAIDTPAGEVEVRGHLAPPPAKLYAFAQEERGPIRQNLDLARFREETGLALHPLSVRQAGPPSEGLRREWPAAASGADKNYGYAFQWWALAGLIAILYVWFQFIVPRRRARA